MTTETPELAPCPKCGKAGRIHHDTSSDYTDHWSFMPSCEDGDCIEGPHFKTEIEAAEWWNRRSAASAEPAVVVAWMVRTADGSTYCHANKSLADEVFESCPPATIQPLYAAPPPSPVVSEEMVQAAGAEFERWDEGSSSRAGKPTEWHVVRQRDDSTWECIATYWTREERDFALVTKRLRAALTAALSHAPAGEVGWREAFDEMLAALIHAGMFIHNGMEFGYIRRPDEGPPSPRPGPFSPHPRQEATSHEHDSRPELFHVSR
jgi:hypothetical protein